MSKPRMTIAIIGSRLFNDYEFMERHFTFEILNLINRREKMPFLPLTDIKIISGGAEGADSNAEQLAQKLGTEFKAYLPKFKTEGTPYKVTDFFDRNKDLARDCDFMLGFLVRLPDQNKGSRHALNSALDYGKEVHVYWR